MTAPAPQIAERAPYLSLEEAQRVVEMIHEQGNGSVTLEMLSPIFGNSAKSSSFQRKLSALRGYGFVDVFGDRVSLTRLGLAYVAPTSDGEKAEAVLQALRNVGIARLLHDRYGGGVLPSRDILANVLLREHGAADPNHLQWADFFIESLRTAKLLSQVGGRITVLKVPAGIGVEPGAVQGATGPAGQNTRTAELPNGGYYGPTGTRADGASGQTGPMGSMSDRTAYSFAGAAPADAHRVELPLGNGVPATIILPKGATADDIDDVIAMLEVMKKRALRRQNETDDDPHGR